MSPSRQPLDSRGFVNYLSAIVNARLFAAGELEVLNTGAAIYAAELEAVRAAKNSIHLEAYLFLRGRAGDEALRVLTERASYFRELRAAGGHVHWYQPIAWYTLKRFNNRTHRDILVVDGEVAFVGGVGVADFWIGPAGRGRPWRDTMVRVQGELVKGLQTSFAENWLEAAGEVLPESE
ncbi:MAG: cardiolipin synthase B, partial [Betaproteobacteria bacterium]